MAFLKPDLDAFLRRKVWPRITSNFAKTKPFLAMIAGNNVADLDKLGDPATGMILGGRDLMGEATRQVTSQNEIHEVIFQKGQTDVAENLLYRAAHTVNTAWAEDNFGTAEFKWSDYFANFKIGRHSIEAANNNQLKLQSLMELALQQAAQRLLAAVNTDLWTGTVSDANQDVRIWPNVIGLQHAVDDGVAEESVYGRIDRSDPTNEIKGVVVLASTLPDTKVRLNIIRKAKLDSGLADEFAGAGTFAIVPADLFSTLIEEAEDRNIRIVQGGVPEIGMEGFKQPVIQYGDTFITYDVTCPAGMMFILTPRSWVFEVAPGANFQLDGPVVDNWKVEEAGGGYSWGRLRTKCRLICREPHLQLKYTGLTAT